MSPKKGKIVIESFNSRLLKNNPLNDPSLRNFPVYLPPSYSSGNKKYPVVYMLMGFTGTGMYNLNLSFLSETIDQRLDRLIGEKKMREMIVVMPDCITKYGGSQYINSTATGKYEDYLVKEIVPYIDSKYRTISKAEARVVCGKSSGGYGAVVLGMKNPDVFKLMCSTAGDMYFEYCYAFGFPKFITDIEPYGGGHKGVANFIKKELGYSQPKPKSFHNIINTIGMASCYSPNPAGVKQHGYNFDLPFNVNTGEIDPKIFAKWQRNDPVRMAGRYKANLKKLNLIYIDAGVRDEFDLNIGARIFTDKLKKNRIKYIHEEFQGGHFSVQYRYDRVLSLVSDHIKS